MTGITLYQTELCRNWQKGSCPYGARCAFAHGIKELKYRTLREMCVFIHDPRVKGPTDAWLYAGFVSKSPSAYPSGESSFFFPDMTRDPDSLELPSHPALYELHHRMATSSNFSSRAVYKLWYSFVATISRELQVKQESSSAGKTGPNANRTGTDRKFHVGSSSVRSVRPQRARLGSGKETGRRGPGWTPERDINLRYNRNEGEKQLPVFQALRMGVPARPISPLSPRAPPLGVLHGCTRCEGRTRSCWKRSDDELLFEWPWDTASAWPPRHGGGVATPPAGPSPLGNDYGSLAVLQSAFERRISRGPEVSVSASDHDAAVFVPVVNEEGYIDYECDRAGEDALRIANAYGRDAIKTSAKLKVLPPCPVTRPSWTSLRGSAVLRQSVRLGFVPQDPTVNDSASLRRFGLSP